MFDPTIYENLKVVLEGAVYDLDLAGVILVTNRVDRVELSTMSRYYSIQFQEKEINDSRALAELRLVASTEDLAFEIMGKEDQSPGCDFEVLFHVQIDDDRECTELEQSLLSIWQNRPSIQQEVKYEYNSHERKLVLKSGFNNEIRLHFGRKIDEGQIEDLKEIIDLTLHSVQMINDFFRN